MARTLTAMKKKYVGPSVEIGGIDFSEHVRSVTLNGQAVGGPAPSLQNWTAEIDFKKDCGEIDEVLFMLTGTERGIVIRPAGGRGFSGVGRFMGFWPHSDKPGGAENLRLTGVGGALCRP